MTCIIGLRENGQVYMGADSCASNGWEGRVTTFPKMFRIGKFLIGSTGSVRMGQILQYHLEIPAQDSETDHEYLVRVFVEAVRSALKGYGYAKIENNQEAGGSFLVGYRSNLYRFDGDFQINAFSDKMDAVGAGREYALGAMLALAELEPEERIKRSLEIASHFSSHVEKPFFVLMDGGEQ
jgi:ATP-dependent protease HslVU (ClpYQ) peptidase subunit